MNANILAIHISFGNTACRQSIWPFVHNFFGCSYDEEINDRVSLNEYANLFLCFAMNVFE